MNTFFTRKRTTQEEMIECTIPHFSKSEDGTTFVCIHSITSLPEGLCQIHGIRVFTLDDAVNIRNHNVDTEEIESNKHEFAAAYGVAMAKLNLNFDAIEKEVSNG